MALLYADGFEWCANTTNLNYKYTVFQNNPWSQATGRFSTGNAMDGNFSLGSELTLNLNQNITSWVMGIAFRKPQVCNGLLIGLRDAATNQVEVRINNDQTLSVTRNATVVSTSSVSLLNDVWYYIEWKVTISNSIASNSCIVKLDGVEIINVPAASNLRNTSNNYAQAVVIGAWSTANCRVDDLYVCNQSGGVNDDFLGDTKVITLYPDGNGFTNQWSVTGAASNYQAVDEATPDGDTSYVSSSTIGQIDLYTYQNTTGSTIHAVQTRRIARKDDVGTREVEPVVRVNSTNYNGTTHVLNTSYVSYNSVWDVNPNTAVAWTESDVNAVETGIELIT